MTLQPDQIKGSAGGERAFTLKSLFLGMVGICLVAGVAGFKENRIAEVAPMIGNHLPATAFFFLTLLALVWNLPCSRFLPALALSSKELTVVMAMTLVACFPPASGLFRYFQRQLILPWYYFASGARPEWAKFGVLAHLPGKLFPQPPPSEVAGVLQLDETVYRGFITGLAQTGQTVGVAGLPWHGWWGPLVYWGLLIVLVSVCVMSLSLLVHRQWAHHEQLSYPLAQVGSAFIHRSRGKGVPDLFLNRLFWWGCIPVLSLYALEYLHQWFPSYVPGLGDVLPNMKSWRVDLYGKLPILRKIPACYPSFLGMQTIYFSVVGLAFFVASEISLTVGLSQILLAGAGVWFLVTTGSPLAADDLTAMRGGAYIGYALILIYTGRTYYRSVFKAAFQFSRAADELAEGVLAARLVLLTFAGTVIVLAAMGLDWFIALLFTGSLLLLFLVFTRIMCETGIPFMQAQWYPAGLLVTLMGPGAVGPGPLVMVWYLGTILCQDPRECLMPYVATGIKMADDAKIRPRRIFGVLVMALLVALTVGFIASTWTMYNFGAITDSWSGKSVPTIYLDKAARQISELAETGSLARSESLSGIGKLAALSVDPVAIGFLAFGLLAVLVFSTLRFRFPRFPLHPVLFLIAGVWATATCWASFLIGWGVKTLVVRFGGGKVYQTAKPLFVGIIAGELLAVALAILVELIYYWLTGEVSGTRFYIMIG